VCITFDDGYYNNIKYVLPLMEQYKVPVTFFITAIRDAGYDILWNDYLGIITKYGPAKIYFNEEEYIKTGNSYFSQKTKRPLAELLRKEDFTAKREMMSAFSDVVAFRDKKEDKDFWQQMNIKDIERLSFSSYSTIGAHGYYHNDLSEISIEESRKELTSSKAYLEKICRKQINALAFPYGHYTREVVDEAKQAGYDRLLALEFHFSDDDNDASMRQRMIVNPYISVINQMYAIVKGRYE
jgi:peptidoglycan/xylan/chitin deacetylase (PgdA/CDA1 family)